MFVQVSMRTGVQPGVPHNARVSYPRPGMKHLLAFLFLSPSMYIRIINNLGDGGADKFELQRTTKRSTKLIHIIHMYRYDIDIM